MYIGTSAGYEFFNVSYLILLFVVRFYLVRLEFLFCADVGIVVATVVDELAIDGEIHNLRAHIVEEVLRV